MAERDSGGVDDKINEIQKTFENRSSDLQRSFHNTCWCRHFLLLLIASAVLFFKDESLSVLQGLIGF